jgi:hypothetical protein
VVNKKTAVEKRSSIREALEAAGSRPSDSASQGEKRRYAELLSHALARMLERDLRRRFGTDSIKAGESKAGSASGAKKLDVNYSDELHGLKLGVSIKTINHRDKNGKGTYTKNRKRVDEEFLSEALDYHVRQPYAVLVGLYFLPIDSCDDGTVRRASSFGQWVQKLFARAGRREPTGNGELFERMFLGLFSQTSGKDYGEVGFFDAETPPPRLGRPPVHHLIGWEQLLSEIVSEYAKRNARFRWADEPAALESIEPDDTPEDEDEESP